ncbi:DedA family protein [Buchnera aphidicola]|uniref:DedA family protein n=1 Tax=Buchnera aphidicola TaxID=9 RepID=UPI0031B86273
MKVFILHLIKKFTSHPIILVMTITFLESLAIIGLVFPGMILMSAIGTLIGSGKLSFYTTWIISIITCSVGDYISYYIGWKFKNWIYRIYIFKKNIILFNKIKNFLHNYSLITILFGKFFGPTRPLIPMMAGMMEIPIKKFIFPSFIGCIIWPILYFIPGICTGLMIKNPHYTLKKTAIWLIFLILLCISILIWITSIYFKNIKNYNFLYTLKIKNIKKYLKKIYYFIILFNKRKK